MEIVCRVTNSEPHNFVKRNSLRRVSVVRIRVRGLWVSIRGGSLAGPGSTVTGINCDWALALHVKKHPHLLVWWKQSSQPVIAVVQPGSGRLVSPNSVVFVHKKICKIVCKLPSHPPHVFGSATPWYSQLVLSVTEAYTERLMCPQIQVTNGYHLFKHVGFFWSFRDYRGTTLWTHSFNGCCWYTFLVNHCYFLTIDNHHDASLRVWIFAAIERLKPQSKYAKLLRFSKRSLWKLVNILRSCKWVVD